MQVLENMASPGKRAVVAFATGAGRAPPQETEVLRIGLAAPPPEHSHPEDLMRRLPQVRLPIHSDPIICSVPPCACCECFLCSAPQISMHIAPIKRGPMNEAKSAWQLHMLHDFWIKEGSPAVHRICFLQAARPMARAAATELGCKDCMV